jgi:hypothetical protein
VEAFGDHPFGLIDDDAAGEGLADLFVDVVSVCGAAVLEDRDRGDVGKGLGSGDVVFVE